MSVQEALGWALIHSIWEGGLIAGVFGVILLSVRSSRIRYVAGCVAMFVMLASFILTFVRFLPERGSAAGTLARITLPPWDARPLTGGNFDRFPDLGILIPRLTPIWIWGVCFFYLRYASGWLSLHRMRQRGVWHAPDYWQRRIARLAAELRISRPVLLFECLLANTPVVVGHLRPAIFVPLGFLTGLPAAHVEAILLHELAHIRRADYLVNVCQRVIEGLLFYHPAVWWISHVIRAERENCCDDMVVELRGDAYDYASALSTLEQQRSTAQAAIAAGGGNLMKRVQRLLYPKQPHSMWVSVAGAVILMASTAMGLAAWHGNNHNPTHVSKQTEQTVNDPWQKWLNEDVVYIISDEERAAFERLKTDPERQHFVEQFWARRDPTPGTAENEFKEEHYRRIAFANDHFAGKAQGWRTDRGRIYIKYGPPDEIDSHPSGGSYQRPDSEGGGTAATYPFEDWRYNHFEGVGSLTIEFVDTTSSGNFRMTLDPKEKYKKP
ncbi:MAG TPA: GWxTD domain-containing protein [Bryobacteraceae bacterium]|jgi:GWxTD domain-containing protein|nr:GWxTD domain-containing protein [Bryobacteraceae bacterium]